MTEFDAQQQRIEAILGNEQQLSFEAVIERFYQHIKAALKLPCEVIGIEDFRWEAYPALIYLYQTDTATALRKTCDQRSPSWEAWFIEEITSRAYAKNRGLTGFEGLVTFYRAQRALTDQLFAKYSYPKLAIENSGGDWDAYRRQILDFLALPFVEDEPVSAKYLRRFVGTYKIVQGSPRRNIFEPFVVALEGQQLVIYDLWWPHQRSYPKRIT